MVYQIMYLPRDVQWVIKSFANEHHVLTHREAFCTAVQTLQKVSPFITLLWRSAHTEAMELKIRVLLRLGALVPKDGVVYHNYRAVRHELRFGMDTFIWGPRAAVVVAKTWRGVTEFPYV